MSEVLKSIINLINENKSNNEICDKLKISKRELYNYLTSLGNIGYSFNKLYNIDGTINYKPKTTYKSYEQGLIEIQNADDRNSTKVLITSDWHVGNEYTRKDLREKLPEYCYDNDIHLILNTGDFINGNYGKGNKRETALTQQEHFLKNLMLII